MIIGVLRESRPGETRVAATPATVVRLLALGHEVVVDPGAGQAAGFTDQAYDDAGASLGRATSGELVLGVEAPSSAQLDELSPGATLVAMLAPALAAGLLADLASRPITALAIDAVPRISRAQSLDVLSSLANIAGYRAVVEAAYAFGRFFTGQVTAAGKVPPARVLVVGAGVAGLAAIGTAGSLGAVVRATDPRPEVGEQVRSLGAELLEVPASAPAASASGHAEEMDEAYRAAEARLYAEECREVDVVITTALIPGRDAPRILTAEMIATMKPGSVVVDMAAANGGNVEGTVAGEVVHTTGGVTLIGYTDLAGRLPAQASQLYGNNLVNLVTLMTPERDGRLVLDLDDVVLRTITVVHEGLLTWPPPPVAVSAAPAPSAAPLPAPQPPATGARGRRPAQTLALVAALGIVLALVAISPAVLQGHLTVFALAVVIGYYVIGHVHHALHTPLMSVTNAVSGIIVVGAVLQVGHGSERGVSTALAALAVLLASINIVGGFAVTRRMLVMFTRS